MVYLALAVDCKVAKGLITEIQHVAMVQTGYKFNATRESHACRTRVTRNKCAC